MAKAKILKEKYGAKLEFLEGWECKPNNLVRVMDIFWNHTMYSQMSILGSTLLTDTINNVIETPQYCYQCTR